GREQNRRCGMSKAGNSISLSLILFPGYRQFFQSLGQVSFARFEDLTQSGRRSALSLTTPMRRRFGGGDADRETHSDAEVSARQRRQFRHSVRGPLPRSGAQRRSGDQYESAFHGQIQPAQRA